MEQADALWQLEKKESEGDYGDPFYKGQYGEDDLADCSFESLGIFSSRYYNGDFSGVCMEIVSFGESYVKVVLSDQNNCRDFVDMDNDEISLCEGDCDDNDSLGVYEQYVFPDLDKDGYYSFEGIQECFGDELPAGFSLEQGSDCDDTNKYVNPGEFESCNGIDDDCDGATDELYRLFYWDSDGDGYGVEENSIYVSFCPTPGGYVSAKGDCDDSNPLVNPGMAELCTDGIDNNCNGMIDFEEDIDSDGYSTCEGDCDDANPAVHPGAKEICSDYTDNDCDGFEDSLDSDCTCSGNGGICTLSSQCPVGYKKIYNSVDYFCSGDFGCCLPLKVATPANQIEK